MKLAIKDSLITGVLFVVAFVALVAGMATGERAQEKPGALPAAATAPAVVPPMPAESAIKLRDAVIAQAKLVIQLKDTITTYNNLQGTLSAQAKTLDDLKAAAIKTANLDPTKWDVDTDAFKFVPKPASPASAGDKKP